MLLTRFIIFLFFLFSFAGYAEERLNAKQLYLTGIKSFSSGEYKESAICFSEFISRYSEEEMMQKAIPRITYFLACSLYNIRQMDRAIDEFNKYLKLAPEGKYREDVLFRLGSAYQSLRDPKKAVTTFQKLLTEFPKFKNRTDVNFQIAVCKLMQEEYEDAIPLLDALSKNNTHPEIADSALAYLIRCLYMNEKYEETFEKIKLAAKQNPPSAHLSLISSIALTLGDKFYDDFEYEKALDAYRCVVSQDSLQKLQKKKILEINRKLAKLKNIDEDSIAKSDRLNVLKMQLINKSAPSENKDAMWYLRLGRCLFDMDLPWEAAIAFKEMKEKFPTNSATPDASASLIYCYAKIGFYDEARKSIDEFIDKYPNHPKASVLLFLKAESYINQENFKAAEKEFKNLIDKYPEMKNKDRAEFYLHLAQAMQEKFNTARLGFLKWKKAYKKSPVKPNVDYWLCMTMFFNGDYSNSIKSLKKFVKKYPDSSYKPDVEYRIGASYYMMENYKKAAIQLANFVNSYTNHILINEARVLRGDALAAMGELPRAIKAYSEAGPSSGPYYHYSVSQIGKCYKMMDDYKNMAKVYKKYVQNIPDSPNVVEGLYQLGWAYRQEGDLKAAREAYWNALTQFGNKQDWSGFSDITRDLNKMYAGSNGFAELEIRLKEEISSACVDDKLTLASRLDIVLYKILKWEKRDKESKQLLAQFTKNYSTNVLGADGLIFLAQENIDSGNIKKSVPYLKLIVSKYNENPIAAEAELRLAQSALRNSKIKLARKLLLSAEEKANNMNIALEIALEKAKLSLAENMPRQAIKQFEEILANRAARGKLWPEALYGIATSYEKLGEYRKAIPYYQRIYVMYSAYTNLTAKAYYNSGNCFFELGDVNAATNTYNEFIADERLAGMPEIELAKKRMKK